MSHYRATRRLDPVHDMTTNPVGIARHPYAHRAPEHAISSGNYRRPYKLDGCGCNSGMGDCGCGGDCGCNGVGDCGCMGDDKAKKKAKPAIPLALLLGGGVVGFFTYKYLLRPILFSK